MTQTHDDDAKKMMELRQRAEERLTQEVPSAANPSPMERDRLVHELNVHQIELELQNEELRSKQVELELSRRKYIDLYEFSPVGLLMLDQNAHIQDPNHTFVAILGVTRHKLANKHVTTFIDPASQDAFHTFYRRLKTTQQPQQCEVVLLPSHQEPLSVRLDGAALAQTDENMMYRISVTDLTTQKQAQASQLELVAERQRVKVLADFVRDLSHDVRTRLTTAVTGLYLVGKAVAQEQAEKLEQISQALFQLNTVLDQLQQLAVLDNTSQLELKPENLNQLIIEVLERSKVQAIAKKVKLLRSLQDDLPEVNLDLNSMDHALTYLIDNALRFTSRNDTISVHTSQENDTIRLEITDTGDGIDGETLPHIFKRFFKGTTSNSLNTSGAGLGLTMTKRIVELHHGMIDITSVPGVKTVVSIKLPR